MPKSAEHHIKKTTEEVKLESIFSPAEASESLEKTAGSFYTQLVPNIQKRNGAVMPFDFHKVVSAVHKAMLATGEGSLEEAEMVAHKVAADAVRIAKKYKNFLPTVEGIQDEVERQLILSDYVQTAKAYILYRQERARLRNLGLVVPERVKELAKESAVYFDGNPLGEFVYLRTYSRWIEEESRRETWIETVNRYVDFMRENLGTKLTEAEYAEVRDAILKHEALPSMRLLQFAGKPARRCNVCAYNCSFIAPSKLEDFGEVLYLSASGTGVGYAVESRNVEQFPQIKEQKGVVLKTHIIDDSKQGWADALTHGIKTWFDGKDVQFDYTLIRPAGARLKTMGGKASGPEPLRSLLDFTRMKILARQGRRLRNIDVHDMCCKIGEAIVSGGVRRSAMISLSDLDDEMIRHAKDGAFYYTEPQRSMANNSAVYETRPSNVEFMDEWVSLMKAGSGERGIFNRGGLMGQLPKRRIDLWKEQGIVEGDRIVGSIGTNPCGEIILQSKQFCNLTEVVARANDTPATLKKKIRIATILGTYQSSLTNFQYLSKEWKENCEAERLLGVSITGQWDSAEVRRPEVLQELKAETIKINKQYAKRFGINASSSITCVKPSGTASQTVNCSSGMHARYSPYYIRRIRITSTDALFKMLKDQGVPYHPEVGQSMESANTYVIEFPVKSPEGSIYRKDISALNQLEYWKLVKENYTEHNPSVTISVGDDEWIAVANWLYEHWDMVGGLSFLPRDNHIYQLAPYEEITAEQYEELLKRFVNVDYAKLVTYELQDETEAKRELACAGGTCEIN